MNTNQQTRNEHWDDLIDSYHVAVRDTFPSNEVSAKDSVLAEFKKRALFTYFLASFFLSYLIGLDNDFNSCEVVAESFIEDIPFELRMEWALKWGGEEATIALNDIFKDMVDRGFL